MKAYRLQNLAMSQSSHHNLSCILLEGSPCVVMRKHLATVHLQRSVPAGHFRLTSEARPKTVAVAGEVDFQQAMKHVQLRNAGQLSQFASRTRHHSCEGSEIIFSICIALFLHQVHGTVAAVRPAVLMQVILWHSDMLLNESLWRLHTLS